MVKDTWPPIAEAFLFDCPDFCIHERFYNLSDDDASDELKERFPYCFKEKGQYDTGMMILEADALPKGSFIKRGYYLIEDVSQYLSEDEGYFDGFYDKLEPEIYAAKLLNESKVGPPQPQKDCEGNDYTPHAASDYMYFAYCDYESEEYEAHLLRSAMDAYEYADILKDAEIVILMTQG